MDFMNRGERPPVQQQTQPAAPGINTQKTPNQNQKSRVKDSSRLQRIGYVGFLGAIAVLLIAVVFSLVFAKSAGSREEAFVSNDQYQAVFLNGGQVYFGKIGELNSKYLAMGSIYYLRVNQQVQPDRQSQPSPNDISLVKLGCELHGPEDVMLINREQVIFWENLKNDGQVAKAIAEYQKANPEGQNCEQQQGGNANSANPEGNAPNGAAPGGANNTPPNNPPAANTPPATP